MNAALYIEPALHAVCRNAAAAHTMNAVMNGHTAPRPSRGAPRTP